MRRMLVLPVLALIAAAGCGSNSSSSSSAPSAASSSSSSTGTSSAAASPAPASAGARLSVSESEFKLTPSTPSVSAGTVSVAVHNAGKVVHALEIENGGAGGKDIKTAAIQPGASATLSAQLKPGKYVWYCPIDGHRGLGVQGTITVGSGGATSGAPARTTSTSSASKTGY